MSISKKNTISEAELTDFIKNKAVKRINIIQNKGGKYEINITLTWKAGEQNLVTIRGKLRVWASLDRMAKHFQKKYDGDLPPITLTIKKTRSEK